MIGWRARIGYISPANAECSVYEFYKIVPEGVSLVTTCLSIKDLVPEELEAALKKVDDAALDLAKSEVDFIVLGGTPPGALKGIGSDRKLISRIEENTKIPAVLKITASVEAFRHLKAKKISVATPFEEPNNQKIKKFLEDSGFTVANIRGLGIRSNMDIARLPDYAPYQQARKTVLENPDTDAIYIPCSQWRHWWRDIRRTSSGGTSLLLTTIAEASISANACVSRQNTGTSHLGAAASAAGHSGLRRV